MEKWRLLETGYADGVTNMAIDEAILLAVAKGKAPPTLRFYGWRPPCLSIGYGQSMREEIDIERCKAAQIDLVRRPTGGKAILHSDEVTYSVVLPSSHPLARGSVLESYRRLSWGLVQGLRALGVKASQAGPLEEKQWLSAACFEVPSDYEVECNGKKLIGSAQLRRKDALLQHGSIPLRGDVTAIVDFLRLPPAQKERLRARLRQRAITLEEILGRAVSFEEVVSAMVQGFKEAFGLQITPGELTPFEKEEAERLRQKYSSDAWNLRH
ncbi:MAG: hypothetical protein DRI61_07105 [Chloroflexi bacterium]|nr:MAG: hypothetical protein DRI61_07105 [Chloroflexota bacterium]